MTTWLKSVKLTPQIVTISIADLAATPIETTGTILARPSLDPSVSSPRNRTVEIFPTTLVSNVKNFSFSVNRESSVKGKDQSVQLTSSY
jgi:hypothetical protein